LFGQDLDDRDFHQASHGVQINVQDGAAVLNAAGKDSAPTMSNHDQWPVFYEGWWMYTQADLAIGARQQCICCRQPGTVTIRAQLHGKNRELDGAPIDMERTVKEAKRLFYRAGRRDEF
jgi:hypothetical protein